VVRLLWINAVLWMVAMSDVDLRAHALSLIASNRYLTLGTVDVDGRPWTTPVYFSAAGVRQYYWMSSPEAEHSRHLAARPHVSFVVFDSTVPPYHGRALYAAGEAVELSGADLDAALDVYPGDEARGGSSITRADVTAPSAWRLYRATASELWVLCPRDPRQPCALHGIDVDHRARVPIEPDWREP
jgi:hypothetical protein